MKKVFMVLPPPGLSPMKTLAFLGEVSISMSHTEVLWSPFHFLSPEDHIPSHIQPAASLCSCAAFLAFLL